jgi:hypothetical protein
VEELNMLMPRILIGLAALLISGLLSACPKEETTRVEVPRDVDVDVNVEDNSADTDTDDTALVPRPKPTGDMWVYVPLERYRTGEEFDTEYVYVPGNDAGKVYVDVIPEGGADEARAAENDPNLHYELSSPQSNVKIKVPNEGRYRVRMTRDTGNSVEVLSESEPFEVVRWESGDFASGRAPYVTITPEGGTLITSYDPGVPVTARFQVPPGFPPDAWIAAVPADAPDTLDLNTLQVTRIADLGESSYVWTPQTPGNYVFRVYPSSGSSYYVAQSETFTVGGAPADPANNPPTGNAEGDPATNPPAGNDSGDRNGNAPGDGS